MTSITLMTNSGFAEQKKPSVVVIGAGLAGLTTAYRLNQKNVDVHVYEARNRVGGRIFTAKIGNDIVELGGLNITDGGDSENMHRLINEFNLELTEYRIYLDHYYFNEKTFLSELLLLHKKKFDPEKLKIQLNLAAQKAHNMRDVLKELLEETDPLYKILSVKLAAFEGAPVEKLSPIYITTLYHMLLGGICAVHQGSYEEDNYADIVSIKEGNFNLPEKLAESLSGRVHLNMPLLKISKTLTNSYELIFQNGQKVNADLLVLAIPCSVYSDITFEENLIPEERLASIRNVQYGTNARILIPFSQTPSKTKIFVSDRVGCLFESSHNISTLYYTGEAGKFSESTILEAYKKERPMIEKGFQELCPPLVTPTLARDESLVSYEGPIGHSWPNDPYVKGSYSYIASGQETLMTSSQNKDGELVRTLFAPINHTLYFAGEHASILMEVPGTMEAACESGERTARMILKLFVAPFLSN